MLRWSKLKAAWLTAATCLLGLAVAGCDCLPGIGCGWLEFFSCDRLCPLIAIGSILD